MPDKHDTYTEPTSPIYETGVTQNLCVKVEKIKDLHQILKNDKGGWLYAELFKLSNKLHKSKLQKIVDLFCITFKLELDQDILEVCAKFQRVSIIRFGESRTESQVTSFVAL